MNEAAEFARVVKELYRLWDWYGSEADEQPEVQKLKRRWDELYSSSRDNPALRRELDRIIQIPHTPGPRRQQ